MLIIPCSLYLAPSPGGAYSFQDLLRKACWRGGSLIERGAYLFIQKPAMEIISLNCNKLKIITQYISYNHIIYIIFESILWGGGLIRKEGLISFFYAKGGGGAYLRGGT